MSKRAKLTNHDPEAHLRHLKRQLESLEKDNHTSISSVEGLVTGALTAQEEEGSK
jgi:zinc finger HIT domain-containing protein 1